MHFIYRAEVSGKKTEPTKWHVCPTKTQIDLSGSSLRPLTTLLVHRKGCDHGLSVSSLDAQTLLLGLSSCGSNILFHAVNGQKTQDFCFSKILPICFSSCFRQVRFLFSHSIY